MPVISIKEAWHFYARGTPVETASLRGLSLDVERGALVALVGPTGSGKSTVLQLLNGTLEPHRGSVMVCGSVTRDRKVRKGLWMKVGLVLQYPEKQFFEETVYREVSFGPRNLGLEAREAGRRVEEALSAVGLDDPAVWSASPFRLSGGEQRRVALASILAVKPDILALDEPTSGIDPGGRKKIFETLVEMKARGITIVMASHNMDDVAALADRVVVLSGGRAVLEGTPGEVFSRPGIIREAGLELPLPCEVIGRLNQSGMGAEKVPLSLEGAADQIYRWVVGKRNIESRSQNPE